MSAPQSVQEMVYKLNQFGGSGVHTTSIDQCLVLYIKMSCHPFLDGPILRFKCVMPLGLSITTKANLLAGKCTFSYFPLCAVVATTVVF